MYEEVKFEDLKNKTLTCIEVVKATYTRALFSNEFPRERINFYTKAKEKYILCHYQDCCERVTIEDICGDLDDLIGVPILLAEEVSSKDIPSKASKSYKGSHTWTFYKLSTNRSSVTIRWYGESTGYYSEKVNFIKEK